MKYSEKAGQQFPDGVISENNIHDFERGMDEDNYLCKCRFSCPFCERTIPIVHKTFWMSSNVTQHLKMHITQGSEEIEIIESYE